MGTRTLHVRRPHANGDLHLVVDSMLYTTDRSTRIHTLGEEFGDFGSLVIEELYGVLTWNDLRRFPAMRKLSLRYANPELLGALVVEPGALTLFRLELIYNGAASLLPHLHRFNPVELELYGAVDLDGSILAPLKTASVATIFIQTSVLTSTLPLELHPEVVALHLSCSTTGPISGSYNSRLVVLTIDRVQGPVVVSGAFPRLSVLTIHSSVVSHLDLPYMTALTELQLNTRSQPFDGGVLHANDGLETECLGENCFCSKFSLALLPNTIQTVSCRLCPRGQPRVLHSGCLPALNALRVVSHAKLDADVGPETRWPVLHNLSLATTVEVVLPDQLTTTSPELQAFTLMAPHIPQLPEFPPVLCDLRLSCKTSAILSFRPKPRLLAHGLYATATTRFEPGTIRILTESLFPTVRRSIRVLTYNNTGSQRYAVFEQAPLEDDEVRRDNHARLRTAITAVARLSRRNLATRLPVELWQHIGRFLRIRFYTPVQHVLMERM